MIIDSLIFITTAGQQQQKSSPISPTLAGQQKRPGGQQPAATGAKSGGVFRVMYDYKANDTDEVSYF